MLNKKLVSVTLAVCTFLLAFAFGSQQAEGIQALPPTLTDLSQVGSATETVADQSHLIPAVVYTTADGHIHELALKGEWQERDLTAAAGAPVADWKVWKPMAFHRSDGVSTIVYRGQSDHILALYLDLDWQGNNWQEVWHWADLTDITGSPPTASDPYGYNRSDGIPTVVYIGYDGHIHDLRLEGTWIWADLTAIAGAPAAATHRPVAYVRADGINAVVFQQDANNHIIELRLDNGWKWADLTSISGAPAVAIAPPSAYVRSDGISTIVYIGQGTDVYELRLDGGWKWANLITLSGAPGEFVDLDPFGYVRSDGINAIVYSRLYASEHPAIDELWLDNGWHYYELTSVPNAVGGVGPVGYVRADGINSVVYRGSSVPDHVQELWLGKDGWHWADLSSLAGGPAVHSLPWPYNRSGMVHTPLTPDAGGKLIYTDILGSLLAIEAPPDAVSEPLALVYSPVPSTTTAPGLGFAGRAFDLEAYIGGELQPDYTFGEPVSMTIHYSNTDVAGLDETLLRLLTWDGSAWQDAACSPYDRHPGDNWLAVSICHLSRFSLQAENKVLVYLPVVLKNQ